MMKQLYLLLAISIKITLLVCMPMNSTTRAYTNQVSLYWFTGITYTGRHNTHSAEVLICGCPDYGSKHCEDGYDANDFNTTGDPTSGLRPGATINDFIRCNY